MLYPLLLNLKKEKSSFFLQVAVFCCLAGSAIPCPSNYGDYGDFGGYGYGFSFSSMDDSSFSSSSFPALVDFCADDPCLNGGTCVNDLEGYHCVCHPDFRGDECQFSDKCNKLAPCDNGGTCKNREGVKGYDCFCAKGFDGKRCKNNINDCDPNPCKNGVKCNDLIADYSCDCDVGKVGKNCSFDDPCYLATQLGTEPCDNNGTCLADETDGSIVCNCTDFFVGPTCKAANPCIEAKCPDNAICVPELIDPTTAKFECQCLFGYMGKDCQFDDPCVYCDKGNCTSSVILSSEGEDIGVDFSCKCEQFWEGTYCDQLIGIDDSDSGYYDTECYEDINGRDYRGTMNTDMYGFPCQSWTAQTPWEHNYIELYPFKGLGNHNFCRNPTDGEWLTTYCISTKNNTDAGEIPIVPCSIQPPQRSCERRLDNECYVEKDGTDYRGTVNVTGTGVPCVSWKTDEHYGSYIPAYGLGDHNYCRNPGGDPLGAWCSTGDAYWDYGYCNIGDPAYACDYIDIDDVIPTWRSKELEEAFLLFDGADYRGQRSNSVKGRLCNNWLTVASAMIAKMPDSGLGNATHSHNYCRNPDNDKTVWCYVDSKNPRVEYCDIGFTWDCEQIEDLECHVKPNGEDYRGRVNNTEGMFTFTNDTGNSDTDDSYTWCMNWNDVDAFTVKYPDLTGHNHCRNPGGEDKHPWCFTGWSNITGWEWSYCNVQPWSVYDIHEYKLEAKFEATMVPDTAMNATMLNSTMGTTSTDDGEVMQTTPSN